MLLSRHYLSGPTSWIGEFSGSHGVSGDDFTEISTTMS
jgi:hypothetical protein